MVKAATAPGLVCNGLRIEVESVCVSLFWLGPKSLIKLFSCRHLSVVYRRVVIGYGFYACDNLRLQVKRKGWVT